MIHCDSAYAARWSESTTVITISRALWDMILPLSSARQESRSRFVGDGWYDISTNVVQGIEVTGPREGHGRALSTITSRLWNS